MSGGVGPGLARLFDSENYFLKAICRAAILAEIVMIINEIPPYGLGEVRWNTSA